MNAQTLQFEHEESAGWRYVMRDASETPVFMSTKYYPTLRDAVQDLETLSHLLEAF